MLPPDLLSYLKPLAERTPPPSDDEFQSALRAGGWGPDVIAEAMAFVHSAAAAKTPPPAVSPSPAPSSPPDRPAGPAGASMFRRASVTEETPPPSGRRPGRRTARLAGLAAAAVILAGGGYLAYAYEKGIGPFFRPPYAPDALFSGLYAKLGSISSASYRLTASASVGPRDPGAEPFALSAGGQSADLLPYKRDEDRFRDLEQAKSQLDAYFRQFRRYPDSLSLVGVDAADPLGASYGYRTTNGGRGFSMTIAFETPEAAKAAAGGGSSGNSNSDSSNNDNKTFTLTEKSPSYFYWDGNPAQPAFGSALASGNSYLNYLPVSASGTLDLSGSAASFWNPAESSGSARLKASADFGYGLFVFDAELLKKGASLYGRINSLPAIIENFADTSAFKGKWINFTSQDVLNNIANAGTAYPGGADAVTAVRKQFADVLSLVVRLADKYGAFDVSLSPGREVVNGINTYRYNLALNAAHFPDFYAALGKELAARYPSGGIPAGDPATLSYLRSPAFAKAVAYLNANSSITLSVDGSGFPAEASYTFRIVPDASVSKFAGKQLNLSFTAGLSDINAPVAISAPAESMAYGDLLVSLSGLTKGEYQFEQQAKNISSVRSALDAFKSVTGRYPNDISELLETGSGALGSTTDATSAAVNSRSKTVNLYAEMYASQPFLSKLPADVFSGVPLLYKRVGTDYALTYTMQIPPYQKGKTPVDGLYAVDYSAGIKRPKLVLQFLSGVNTANSLHSSAEAFADSKKDSNGDGIPDTLKAYLGIPQYERSANGDPYALAKRLIDGYDPLGPGKLEPLGNRTPYF